VAELAEQHAAADQEAVSEAPALLRILYADPSHTAEHLVLWSIKRFAGRATSAVARIQRSHLGAEPAVLQRAVVQRQTRVSMTEGAVVGGPFIVLIPVAFCAALLAQAQMILELAVLDGRPADDELRGAELLVLQRVYPSVEQAQAGLARVRRDLDGRHEAKLPRGTRWITLKRMALLLGLLGSEEERPGFIRTVLQWIFLGLLFLVSFVLPLIWAPYMAAAMRRSSLEIGNRGMRFYANEANLDADRPDRTDRTGRTVRTVRVPIFGTVVRTVVLVVVPIVVAVIALGFDVQLGSGKLLTAGLLFIVASAVSTLGWIAYRRLRKHPI
jgi:hypothetical protein